MSEETSVTEHEHRAVSEVECACGYGKKADANSLSQPIPDRLRAKALRMHLAVKAG